MHNLSPPGPEPVNKILVLIRRRGPGGRAGPREALPPEGAPEPTPARGAGGSKTLILFTGERAWRARYGLSRPPAGTTPLVVKMGGYYDPPPWVTSDK